MKYLILAFSFMVTVSCSENLYDEFADKDTPEAIFFDAKIALNDRDYAGAIALLQSLDPTFLAARERVPVHASAFSGRCGLEFLTLLQNLENAGSGTVFVTLMSAFPGALAANVQDCIDAETIMDGIGDATVRNGDENLFMAFISFAKIGTILSSLADTDDNGTADAGFDQCDNTDFPDATVRELGASLAVAITSLTALTTSYVDDTITEVNNLCALDANLNNYCTLTDPAAFSASEIQALRYLIGSNDAGIDSCGGNDFTNCAIANPVCP